MDELKLRLEQLRASFAERYPVVVDRTVWSWDGSSLRVEGGVLSKAQANAYTDGLKDLDPAPPTPTVLSDLDADWQEQRWVLLPEGETADLHRNAREEDLQTQWAGEAWLRHFADESVGKRSLIQLPDATLGWVRSGQLRKGLEPQGDPWAHIGRTAAGRTVPSPTAIDTLATHARRRLGQPYLWGGNTEGAADCSGFVQSILLGTSGLLLPKHTSDQRRMGVRIPAAAIAAGDLVFVRGRDKGIGHVGLALPGPEGAAEPVSVIHSCLSRGEVLEDPLSDFLSRYRFTGARRVVAWEAGG